MQGGPSPLFIEIKWQAKQVIELMHQLL